MSTALISHFHDDHVCTALTLLAQLHGTNAGHPEAFADLLARTGTWPAATGRSRSASTAASASTRSCSGEEYTFRFAPPKGHTLCQPDRLRAGWQAFAHTGDSTFSCARRLLARCRRGPIARWDDKGAFFRITSQRCSARRLSAERGGCWPGAPTCDQRPPAADADRCALFDLVGRWSG